MSSILSIILALLLGKKDKRNHETNIRISILTKLKYVGFLFKQKLSLILCSFCNSSWFCFLKLLLFLSSVSSGALLDFGPIQYREFGQLSPSYCTVPNTSLYKTLLCTTNIVQHMLYSLQCTVYSVPCIVYSVQCTIYN